MEKGVRRANHMYMYIWINLCRCCQIPNILFTRKLIFDHPAHAHDVKLRLDGFAPSYLAFIYSYMYLLE